MTPNQCQSAAYEISDPAQIPPSPTVSVLMLAYNHEAYVRQAIESILEQEVDFPFEIVIGEDCSTDRTREILLQYQSQRPELFRIVTAGVNVGMNENFKRTSEACRGKYVAICEADDYWVDAKKLSLQLAIAESRPEVSFVVHNAMVVPYGQARHLMASMNSDVIFGAKDIFDERGQFAATASYFMKREVLSSLPSWLDTAPVIDFFIEAYSQLLGVGYYMQKTMSIYRVGQPGGWTDKTFKSEYNAIAFQYKMIECISKMIQDFSHFEKLLKKRRAYASRIIMFKSASISKECFSYYFERCYSFLSLSERGIARLGPSVFRTWYRISWRISCFMLRFSRCQKKINTSV